MTFTSKDKVLWINHAIAYYESIGKNQKQLAADIGLEESRISELKRGKGAFSPTLRENIIDLCGAPQRAPGRFEIAEFYPSLEDFLSAIPEEAVTRYNQKAAYWLEEKTEFILKNQILWEADFYKEPEPTTPGVVAFKDFDEVDRASITQKEEDAAKLTHLNRLLGRKDVGLLFKQFETLRAAISTTGKHYEEELNLLARKLNDKTGCCRENHQLTKLFICWYLMWRLRQSAPSYRFGQPNQAALFEHVPLEEVILTGDRVMAFSSDVNKSPLSQTEGGPILFSHTHYISNQKLRRNDAYFTGDIWPQIRFEVYLGENLTYHFLFHFSGLNQPRNDSHLNIPSLTVPTKNQTEDPDPTELPEHEKDITVKTSDRIAVIPNIAATQLYVQIQQVRKAFGLSEDSLYTLKSAIAKAGGHIPGARILS